MILGCIADDFTGGTDLANNLVRAGMRTVQLIGVSEGESPDCDAAVVALQARILDEAAALVAPGGVLVYATCSLIEAENTDQVAGFLSRHPGWTSPWQRRFTPLDGGDGFYAAALTCG